MRKWDKYTLLFLAFFLLTVITYLLFYFKIGHKEFQKSFSFIWQHLFVIAILLLSRKNIESSFAGLLLWGVIVYKIELIIYNLALAFILIYKKEWYSGLNCSYDVVLSLSASIGLIILSCKFFDQIVIAISKFIHALKYLLKWKRQ